MLYADRVQETTTTTGTGTVTLAGAVLGFRTFASSFSTGDPLRYVIVGASEWEVGEGELTSSTTLTRTTVFSSSNAGALVSFSAGSKAVFCAQPAQAIADIGMTIAFASLRVPQ